MPKSNLNASYDSGADHMCADHIRHLYSDEFTFHSNMRSKAKTKHGLDVSCAERCQCNGCLSVP